MNLKKLITITCLVILSGLTYALNPSLNLSGVSKQQELSITLTVKDANTIQNLQFKGLESVPIVGREVVFNSSSNNESANQFQTKLYLMPLTAQTVTVYVTATVNGKKLESNKINLVITKDQVTAYQVQQKQQAILARKQYQKLQKQIDTQIKSQQKFFDNINSLMQKQQAEMLKTQQEMLKDLPQ